METHNGAQNACGCRSMHVPILPTASGSPIKTIKSSEDTKYFQEIGAEMIGNQLIIRVEKDKNKSSKKKIGQWDPPCECEIPEIRMPSATEGPKIMNAGDNNQIMFRIRSRTLIGQDDADYKPEAFSYQLADTNKGKGTNDQYRSIMVHPNLNDPAASQEVHSDHITDGNQNIYLLRIKKKSESSGQRKRNIELEVRTPKPPPPSPGVAKVPPPKLDESKPLQSQVETNVETNNNAKEDKDKKKKDKKKKDKKKKKKK